MRNIISKVTVILTELNFHYMILKSQKDTVILFYKSIDTENIIFGISLDPQSKYIDMGSLCLPEESVILGCSHRLLITSDLKNIIQKTIHQMKKTIEMSDQMVYFDDKMKLRQKFSNINTVIDNFAHKNNYTLF